VVHDGKGGQYIYGEEDTAREGNEFISRWWLSRIVDPAGHSVRFYYQKDKSTESLSIHAIAFVERTQKVSYAFAFRYEDLTVPWTSYLSGNRRSLNKRVTSVSGYWMEQSVTADDLREPNWDPPAPKRLFDVRLSYGEVGSSRRSILQKIERFGVTDNDVTPVTELGYSLPCLNSAPGCKTTASFQTDVALSGKPPLNSVSSRILDINSDGLLDILGHSQGPGTTGVWFNSGADSSENWMQFTSKYPLPLQNVSFELKDRLFMDINGDRLMDMIFAKKAYLNLGGNVPLWNTPGVPITGLEGTPPPNDATKGAWVDINADSRTDYVQYVIGPDGSSMSLKVFINAGGKDSIVFKTAQITQLQPSQPLPNRKLDWADMNGDGLVDLIMFLPSPDAGTNQIRYWINQGQNRFTPQQVASIAGYTEQKSPRWFDVNADGYVDAVIAMQGAGLRIFLSNAQGLFEPSTASFPSNILDTASSFEFGDMNGNGSRDIVVTYGGNRLAIYDPYFNEDIKAPYILKEVRNSLGSIDIYEYRSSAVGLAEQPLQGRLPITMQMPKRWQQLATRFNTQGAYLRQLAGARDYAYQKGFYNTDRNEFLGFSFVREVMYHEADPTQPTGFRNQGQITETTYYTTENNGLLHGRIKSQRMSSLSTGELQSTLDNEYGVYQLFENRPIYLPVLKSSQTRKFEGQNFSQIDQKYCTNLYAQQGLPSRIVKTESIDGKEYRITETQYQEPGNHWLVRFPKVMKLFEPTQGLIYLGKAFEYHPELCRITQVSRLNASEKWQITHTAEYDANGNMELYRDADGTYSRLQYTDPGAFLPTAVETSAGPGSPTLLKKASYNYLAGAQLETYTDENGKRSRLEYDGLGRLLRWFTPLSGDKPAYSFQYGWGSSTEPSKIRSTQFGRTASEIQFLDALLTPAALIVPSDKGFILKRFSVQGLAGQTLTSTQPRPLDGEEFTDIALDPQFISRFTYDEKLRKQLIDNPGFQGTRTVTNFQYGWESGNFSTIRISPEKQQKKTLVDALGRAIATSEINSSQGSELEAVIRAEYDISNRITLLRPTDGRPRRYLYNQAGQLYQISGDDIGTHTFEYTAGDLLKAKLSSGSSNIAAASVYYSYDGLKRDTEVRQLTSASLSFDQGWNQAKTVYSKVYDISPFDNNAQSNLLGRLAYLKLFPGAYYEYSYDDDGNRNREEVQLYDKRFKTEFSYSPTGQTETVRYPDDELLVYEYSAQSGLLRQVKGLVNTIERDRLGRPLSLDLSAGIGSDSLEMTHSYDESTGLVTGFALNGVNPILVSRYEDYDLDGRLKKASGFDSILSEIEQSYRYDKRGQLTSATLSWNDKETPPQTLDLQFSYDNNGDILEFENKRFEYTRNEKGSVTSIVQGQDKWTFDDLGRLQTSPSIKKAGWFNAATPACFINERVTYRYSYFPDGTRFSEVRDDANGTRSTAFLNRYVEYTKETDSLRKYYFVDGLRLAVSENKVRSLLVEDLIHSGRMRLSGKDVSYYALHKPYGEKVIDRQLSSFAEHRYQFAGGLTDSGIDAQQFGNRFYDAKLGRFLQRDTAVLENPALCLKDSISCQLYSYARNNPVFMTDPSGELPVPAIIILGSAVGGGVIGGVSSLVNDYMDSGTISQAALARAGVSALSGAVKGGLGGFMAVSGYAGATSTTIAISSIVSTMESAVNEQLSAKEQQRPVSLMNIARNTGLSLASDVVGNATIKGGERAFSAVVKEFGSSLAFAERVVGVGARVTPALGRDAAWGAGIEAVKTMVSKAFDAMSANPSTKAQASDPASTPQASTESGSTSTPETDAASAPTEMPAESVFGTPTSKGSEIPSSDACASCIED
jgi:RHS repeat-associated protein